ncbi:MAG: hypothetical protein ABFC94_12265 [Syntrophomonas sp.]
MRGYWQLEFYVEGHHKIRYLYGTDAAVQRRVKRYNPDSKILIKLDKAKVQYLKTEKNARFITL